MSKELTVEAQVQHAYVAIEHLQHDRPLVDLAEELRLSRFMIGRMVKRARAEGLIEVRPRLARPINPELSRALTRRFGITAAYVVESGSRFERLRTIIAGLSALVVTELIQADDIVGLGPGRTIIEMCRSMIEVAECDVVQLTGVASGEPSDSVEAITALSRIAEGRTYPLHAPFVATDAAAATAIIAQPAVRETLTRMDSLNKAVVTVGGWPKSSLLATQIDKLGELEEATARGVVAELGTTLLDIRGRELHVLDGRTIGISTAQLAAVPLTIAIGGGTEKRQAVLATLRSGLIDVLISDAGVARFLLDESTR